MPSGAGSTWLDGAPFGAAVAAAGHDVAGRHLLPGQGVQCHDQAGLVVLGRGEHVCGFLVFQQEPGGLLLAVQGIRDYRPVAQA